MPTSYTWNSGDPLRFVEIVSQAYAAADGGAVKNFYNVYHFKRTTTVNTLSKSGIQGAFQTAIMIPVLAALNVDYTQVSNTIRFFEDPSDSPIATAQAGTGGRTGERIPDFNAAVIQLKSSTRGKTGRGSKHYGPIAVGDSLGDILTAGSVTRFNAVGAAILAGFTDPQGNVWVPGLKAAARGILPWKYVLPLPTVIGWTEITSTLLNKTLGTMKRRKVRTVT